MYTSTLLFALLSVPGAADTPTWSTDYTAARKESATKGKPLAVFLGSGKTGYEKVVRDGGELSAACRRHLASNYVCVAIDTSTEAGKRMASDFDMPSGQGIVISDRTGAVQAFRHEGNLTNNDLHAYLERYASDRAISTTETANSIRSASFEDAEDAGKDPKKEPIKEPKKDGAMKPLADHVVWVGGGSGCGSVSCGGGSYSSCGHHGHCGRGGRHHRGGRCR